jgi:hypothetical protein
MVRQILQTAPRNKGEWLRWMENAKIRDIISPGSLWEGSDSGRMTVNVRESRDHCDHSPSIWMSRLSRANLQARESIFASGPEHYIGEIQARCPPDLEECVLAIEDCCEEVLAPFVFS